MVRDRSRLLSCLGLALAAVVLRSPTFAQADDPPQQQLAEAERLAWLKAWTKAEPLFDQARRAFAAKGDRRNALYAEINALRGRLPHLAVPDVSEQLANYLQDPIVHGDDRLRLRALVIKGETDEDLDPALAERSWKEALALAEKLGEAGWANRARGELGLVAFLLGDIDSAIVRLGQAMKVAETNGDVASLVRWLTLFGHGYVQLDRAEQALDFYDRALKLASTVPELQFPLMTYQGKGDALARLGKLSDAKRVLADALAVAQREDASGYQGVLLLQQGLISHQERDTSGALAQLTRATKLASKAGGNRILAEIALERGRIERTSGRTSDAVVTLDAGVKTARRMGERFLLPRLLAELAEIRLSQQSYTAARDLLKEASDVLEGLLTNASSPWVRSRIIGGMDGVLRARIRLEGSQAGTASKLFAVLEQARGRSMLELLASRENSIKSAELEVDERRIATLQLRLLRTTSRTDRERLLAEILRAEERLAPASTQAFTRSRAVARRPIMLRDLQRTLRSDEVLLEFALADPISYVVVATVGSARIQRLGSRGEIREALEQLSLAVRRGSNTDGAARRAGRLLIGEIPELITHKRVIVSPDAELHLVPVEVFVTTAGKPLVESHVVSYVPSASVLGVLRNQNTGQRPPQIALAISSSPENATVVPPAGVGSPSLPSVTRGVYDLDASQLQPLPLANDEARAVVTTLGSSRSTLLIGDQATEHELKRHVLNEYAVLHFAAHGIVSTKYPARSALLLRPADGDDGLVQAREILDWRLAADLVTLSACDTGAGTVHGQEGVSSLVRPFLTAGARSVVANLWTADDRFSLALMREFYRQLASGVDVGEALRRSKLRMIEEFGPEALPRLWSGVLVYGDGAAALRRAGALGATGGTDAGRK